MNFLPFLNVQRLDNILLFIRIFFYLVQQPPEGQGLLTHEVSRSQSTNTTVGRTPLDEFKKLLQVF